LVHETETDRSRLDDERFLLESILAKGARCVGMTDGVRGAWATDGTDFLFAPIHTLGPVIDSTGAGDAFTSGFLAGQVREVSLRESLAMGMLNSGGVVTRYGAIEGLRTEADYRDLLGGVEVATF
jgi:sugar/nucleoside kinase (ribokinase family)